MSKVGVAVDERVRLVGAVLAASDWPAREREVQGAHAVHPQAKTARRFLERYASQPVVGATNSFLAAGGAPATLFTAALRCSWPDFVAQEPLPEPAEAFSWPAQLAAFQAELVATAPFVEGHEEAWQEAVSDLQRIFAGVDLPGFLEQLVGHSTEARIVAVPNLLYPALATVAVAAGGIYYLIIPPPKAVGESPPWPYRDEEEGVLATACYHALSPLLADPLRALSSAQEQRLRHTATALFLKQAVDETAAHFYLLQRQKEDAWTELAGTMASVRLVLDCDGRALSLDLLLSRLFP